MMAQAVRLRWTILKTSIEERLAYRGDFIFGTLVRFLPTVTQIFLWSAIFAASKSGPGGKINGYTYQSMIAYYLLVMVSRAFSSMPGLAEGIALEIRDGTIKKYLTQPIDMLGYLFWHRMAHKLVYYFIATLPFALVFWLCRGYFNGWPDALTTTCWVLSLLLSFLLGFLMEALIGLIGFWFLEVSSLVFIYMMINFFLSGQMIPIDWLPHVVQRPLDFLPFKYLAYFPAAVMIKGYSHSELAFELLVLVGWVVVFFIACRTAFALGLRRYGAYGG